MNILISHLIKAIRSPEAALDRTSVFRKILRLPILYDLTNLIMQRYSFRYIKNTEKLGIKDNGYYDKVQKYNAKVTLYKSYTVTRRAEELFAALTLPPESVKDNKLLLIGPRTVQEFYLAWLYGFTWNNIEGIDLYKTHPKIQVMNMEKMTHADSSFDSILMSATLAYAKDVCQCLSECARVLKPGGRLVFAQTYCPASDDYPGDKVNGSTTLNHLLMIDLQPFYYRQIEKINKLGQRQTYHLFGVQKKSGLQLFDEINWGEIKRPN